MINDMVGRGNNTGAQIDIQATTMRTVLSDGLERG
jgi:hypothetical protein